jgi:hypothetical protein
VRSSTDKKDLKDKALQANVIAPLSDLLSSKQRAAINKYLMDNLLVPSLLDDGDYAEHPAQDILEAILKFVHSELPPTSGFAARTNPPTLSVTSAVRKKTAAAVAKANAAPLPRKKILKIYAHVKSNFANNVLVRLLHELPGMPPVFAVEPANESYSKPPRALHAATLQSVKRMLKPQRKAFTFADEYTRQLQDEDDYDLVAPPVGLLHAPFCSKLDAERKPVFVAAESPLVKAFEKIEVGLGMNVETEDLSVALLSLVTAIAQHKMKVVTKAGDAEGFTFEQMPQPKAVEEEIKELMEFFNDADACPTDYPRLKKARGEAE